MQQSNTNKGEKRLFLIINFRCRERLFHTKTFNKNLTLAGGLRFDNRNVDAKEMLEDTDVKFAKNLIKLQRNFWKFRFVLSIRQAIYFKLNLSRGFRAPNIAELSSNGIHMKELFRYEIGDINLKSEISHQIDAAYFLNSDHISFEFTLFVNFISKLYLYRKMQDANGNDVIIDPNDPVPAFRFTQGNAQLFGGEIFLDFHPHPFDWLHVENSFSYVRATQNNRPENESFAIYSSAKISWRN